MATLRTIRSDRSQGASGTPVAAGSGSVPGSPPNSVRSDPTTPSSVPTTTTSPEPGTSVAYLPAGPATVQPGPVLTQHVDACFSALVPDTWALTEEAGWREYGRRTAWAQGSAELFVDTAPVQDASITGWQAAQEQYDRVSTATSGLVAEDGREDMWSYRYTRGGVPAIAIYFMDARGFGIVGSGSEAAIAAARLVAGSIEVVDPSC